MEKWVEEGQSKWMYERVSAVVFGGVRAMSANQPVWGTDEEGMNGYRGALENHIAMSGRERLLIVGDFNFSCIDWNNYKCSSKSKDFLCAVENNFITQKIV